MHLKLTFVFSPDLTGAQDGSVRMFEWGHSQQIICFRSPGNSRVTRIRFNHQGNKVRTSRSSCISRPGRPHENPAVQALLIIMCWRWLMTQSHDHKVNQTFRVVVYYPCDKVSGDTGWWTQVTVTSLNTFLAINPELIRSWISQRWHFIWHYNVLPGFIRRHNWATEGEIVICIFTFGGMLNGWH